MKKIKPQIKQLVYYASGVLLIIFGTRSLVNLLSSLQLFPALSYAASRKEIFVYFMSALFSLLGAASLFLTKIDGEDSAEQGKKKNIQHSTSSDNQPQLVPKLIIDHGSKDHPGLQFIYTGKSRLYSPAELLMLLLGIISVVVSLVSVYSYNPIRWEGFAILVVAFAFFAKFWKMHKNSSRFETLRYSVIVEHGLVGFSSGYDKKQICLSKIGRLYISTHRRNGVLKEAYVNAYYDGDTIPVLNIIDLYRRLDAKCSVVLDHIVDYLNSAAADAYKKQKPKPKASRFEPIQAGWQSDYATDTPIAARNLKPLASRKKRMATAFALGLITYVIDQSPVFSLEQGYYPALVSLFAMFGLPLLYFQAIKLVSACACRKATGVLCSFAIIVYSLTLSYLFYMYAKNSGASLSPFVNALVFIPPVVWLLYYTLSGCSCGARNTKQADQLR